MRRVLLTALVILLASAATANAAWNAATPNAGNRMTAATLAAPATASLTIPFDCATANVSWGAVAGAAGYDIERTTNGGATWSDVTLTTGTGTAYADAANFTGSVTAQYRVANRTTAGSWTSAFTTSSAVTCSQANTLAVTNASGADALTWNAATSATGYDIERRTNNGSWVVLQSNRAGVTYSDTAQYTNGATIDYRVRAVSSTGLRGAYTNVATVASWSNTTSTGLAVTRTITSESTTSYCATITVRNNNTRTVTWRTTLSLATYPLDGAVTSQSNITTVSMNGTDWTIGGVAFNQTLAAGATASGSYCANRTFQTAAADVSFRLTMDYGSGYCAEATVSTTSTTPINWNATLTKSMSPDPTYWPASQPMTANATTISFSPTTWVLKGVGYNDWVVAGTNRTFSWCATKSAS